MASTATPASAGADPLQKETSAHFSSGKQTDERTNDASRRATKGQAGDHSRELAGKLSQGKQSTNFATHGGRQQL